FMPVMWFGFWLNAVSGVALLVAYPTKALTNPVFYLKLALIALAVWLASLIGGRVFGDSTPPPRAPAGAAQRLCAACLRRSRLLGGSDYSGPVAGLHLHPADDDILRRAWTYSKSGSRGP